ncbi:MAG: Eco57I restriction-modification methylase domain-containing protein [Gemmatimonadota bacterium]|nr:Eco57I restriction-modification methylase domain-containing protein [Gemmatimonadota bacterium]
MTYPDIRDDIRSALERIPYDDFDVAAKRLLEALGYQSERTQELSGSVDDFIREFPAPNQNTKTEKEFRELTQSLKLIFQVTSDEIASSTQPTIAFDPASFDKGQQQSFIFFAVELKEATYARGQYAQFTREINKRMSQPTVVLFSTADHRLTLSFVHRREHKRDPERDVLGNVSLIREVAPENPHRAHLDILAELSLAECTKWMDLHNKPNNFDGLLAAWLEKLDTEELNRQFYRELFDWYERAVKDARFPKSVPAEQQVIRLITRILFVWFIKEKGLVREEWFIQAEMEELLSNFGGSDYYRAVLQNLFFATLNAEMHARGFSTQREPSHRVFSRYRYKSLIDDVERFEDLMNQTPFINGGLFDCLDDEESRSAGGKRIDMFSDPDPNEGSLAAQARRDAWRELNVPDALFFDEEYGLFPLLNHYKFTVEENTPIEQEVALDPELLGKVFENLLAAYNPETRETARKQTGSYYTPRVVVDYMVDEALVETLKQKCLPKSGNTDDWDTSLRWLLDYADEFNDVDVLFDKSGKESIIRAIADLKVIDPAVGSGAFPMGILHKLILALQRLDPDNEHWQALQKERARTRVDAAFETGDQRQRNAELLEISETFQRYSGDFGRKLYLIQNSIFGVDIQPVACQIARLRFFISLAIEQKSDETAKNLGIKPLPNLETRFVVANTLIGLEGERMLKNRRAQDLERELNENREQHFHASTRQRKLECKEKDEILRTQLATELRNLGLPTDAALNIAHWDPYDQNTVAHWFDTEYMFGITGGFDVVIGNPPYVSHDKIPKHQKSIVRKSYLSYQPFADLYCYFIEKALRLQNNTGVLSFITSNSYLRAEYGAPIRELLSKRNALLRVLSIEDSQVFASAIVNVAIIVSCKSSQMFDEPCVVVNSPLTSGIPIEDFVESNGFDYPQAGAYLDANPWTLIRPELIKLQRKIASTGKTLEQLKTKIRLGIATGSNEAFIIDEEKKRELCEKSPVNTAIIKPILRGRDIHRYSYISSGQHILLARNGVNIRRDYPQIYKHFESFGGKFKNRGARGKHWTNLRACSFYDDFKKEKIVWIELTDLGRFALCNEEIYLLNSAYFLIPPSGIDSKFLLGVLNSSTIRFCLYVTAETSGMGTSRWINNYVKQFPIPIIPRENQFQIANIVDKILDAKRVNNGADTSEQEVQIDRLVYALYGLTAEEVAAVENILGAEETD